MSPPAGTKDAEDRILLVNGVGEVAKKKVLRITHWMCVRKYDVFPTPAELYKICNRINKSCTEYTLTTRRSIN